MTDVRILDPNKVVETDRKFMFRFLELVVRQRGVLQNQWDIFNVKKFYSLLKDISPSFLYFLKCYFLVIKEDWIKLTDYFHKIDIGEQKNEVRVKKLHLFSF